MPISKPDFNLIFASQAPSQDLPAAFNNYARGWDEARKNNGKPTIKQFNYLIQQLDLKALWVIQNGAALPFDETADYAEGAFTVKDGSLQQLVGGVWKKPTQTADQIFDESGLSQQKVNYNGGSKWHSRTGGYKLNERVVLTNSDIVKSTVDGNTNDPNVNMTGWVKTSESSQLSYLNRSIKEKLDESFSAKDGGALANNTGNDAIALNSLPSIKLLNTGVFRITEPLKYRQNQVWQGSGKGFSGSVIRPAANFTAITFDASFLEDRAKNSFSDIQIEAIDTTTSPSLVLDRAFLSEIDRVWIRNSPLGVQITNSDSITFNQLMVMEDSKGLAVKIGDSARNIRFFGCNFEKNPRNSTPNAGKVKIDGNAGFVASATFVACQTERSGLEVLSGTAKWYGGKIGASSQVLFGVKSSNCYIDSDIDDSSSIYDFGWSNRIDNAYSTNMQTPVFFFPTLQQQSGKTTFGAQGEYLVVVSAGAKTNAGVTSGQITLKDGATPLVSSPTFNLQALGVSVGMTKRPAYTYISCVNASTNEGVTVDIANASPFSVRGGKSILINGTFVGGITGWTATGATTAQDVNDDVVITPSGNAWSLLQNLNNKLVAGRKYIAMAKYSGLASLVLGVANNGTVGARTSFSAGVSDLYGDGDTVAQIAFEYKNGLGQILSFGSVNSSSPVTLRWIALIEMVEQGGLKTNKIYDPPSLATATQQSTTITLAGAYLGSLVACSFSNPLNGTRIWAEVTAENTVTVYHRNDTGTTVDIESGTLTVELI